MIQGKNLFKLTLVLIFAIILSGTVSATSNSTLTSDQQSQVMNAQIPFVENNGQTDSSVSFYADTFYGTAFITNSSIVHSIKGANNTTLVVKEEFLDANGDVIDFQATGVEQGSAKVDFYIGNDSSQWRTGVNTWNTISLGELYPGITVLLRASGDNVEKIFQIAPGANPKMIKIQITGADGLSIDQNGNLDLLSEICEIQLSKPIAYQKDQNIEATYQISNNYYGFNVGYYDTQEMLTIDPTLHYSTYLGGSDGDEGNAIALDLNNNIYITGYTKSMNFPTTTGAIDSTFNGNSDVFISKFVANGQGTSDLKYSSYIGTSYTEVPHGIIVDNNGNIYITGSTNGNLSGGDYDVFLYKLTVNGDRYNLSKSFIGGSNYDSGQSIKLDSSLNVYITGYTNSNDFPVTSGAYQATKHNLNDAFIVKIAPNGDLLYSTYIGGNSDDFGYSLALDTSGDIYITGYTWSTDFPTTSGAYQTTNHGNCDLFISKLTPNGGGITDLKYSTYIGGSDSEFGWGIIIDSSQNIYVTGMTSSTDFPTTIGAYDETFNGNSDAFIVKLKPNNQVINDLKYSTYLGGSGQDRGNGIALDSNNNVYITGETGGSFPVTIGAFQGNKPDNDAFISKIALNSQGIYDLKYSTFFGGFGSDSGNGIAIATNGYVYIIGNTLSSDLPVTTGAYQTTKKGSSDVFVSKLHLPIDVYPGQSIQAAINAAEPGDTILIHGNNGNPCTYNESLTLGKQLTILSAGDGIVTISTVGLGKQNTILINSGGSGSIIQGFTITGPISGVQSIGFNVQNGADNLTITNNLINTFIGIYFYGTNSLISNNQITSKSSAINLSNNNNIVSGNTISNGGVGIDGSNNIFENNIISNIGVGIGGSNNIIENNIISNCNGRGIGCSGTYNTISNNTIENCTDFAIYVTPNNTSNFTIIGNVIRNNFGGIHLQATNCTLKNNIIENNSINLRIWWYENYADFQHDIDESNTINGKPIKYLIGASDLIIDSIDLGYLGLISCDNITVKNINISNNGEGILIADSKNLKIENCTFNNNQVGFYLYNSSNNSISGNKLIDNNLDNSYGYCYGILIDNSNNNIFSNNIISNIETNLQAIVLTQSSYNTFYSNNIKDGWISIGNSSNNEIYSNYFNSLAISGDSSINNYIYLNSISSNSSICNFTTQTLDLTNNWWGTNNPVNNIQGDVDYDPWIKLYTSSNPSTITTASTSTITADLTFNSAYQDTKLLYPGKYVPDGISALFVSDSYGSFGGQSSYTSNTVNGTTTAIFSPFTSAGVSTINISVDDALNIPTTVTITPSPIVNTRTLKTYDSIQAAIDDAETMNGDILNIGNGTYIENVTINKQLTLEAQGATIHPFNNSLPIFTIITDGNGSSILGFTLNGAINSFGIYINSANNCQITNNILSSNFMGIYIQNSTNNNISGNTIQNNRWLGICLDNSSNNNINGGNVINNNVEGVYIVNTANGNIISGNNIYNNTDAGINILKGSTGNTISDNTAISQNSVIGILIRDSNSNIIRGNNIQNNGWAGIALDDADENTINGTNIISGNVEGIQITNNSNMNIINENTITYNTNIGISLINNSTGNNITLNTAISNNGIIGVYLRDSNTNTISGNTIQINGWVGICLDNATGNTINSANYVSGNMEGLYIVNNSNTNTITANNINGNTDTGIYIDGSTENQITSNTAISNNGVLGILLRNADNNTISGNTLQHNNWVGIALDNADNNNINGLNIIDGSQEGLYITNSSENTIDNNRVINNTNNGINILNNSNNNTIINNHINSNQVIGLFIQNSTSNAFQNNKVETQGWAGIILDTTTNTTVYHNNFTNNPLQALAQNGTENTFYMGTCGNYWLDWPSTEPRFITGNEGLYDEYPSITPF